MAPVVYTAPGISIHQAEVVRKDGGRRFRVSRSDGTDIGEFTLIPSDDGWMPVPVPGATHAGLLHTSAIDFAREVNEGRVRLETGASFR